LQEVFVHHQVPLDDQARADEPQHDVVRAIAPDLAYTRVVFVNVQLFGTPGAGDRQWVLVDTGVPGGSTRIIRAAEERFGANARPAAIVMTHGHFDHAGTVESLAERWDAPVYAHAAELPYLNGQASYPPADPTVGGGLMSRLSPLLPSGPVNVSRWLRALPEDRSVPGMPGWRWFHTPGHTPGHVSLWRASDRTLIAGDAFITTNMESAYGALSQRSEMHGPPQFITQDWVQSKGSVQRLAELEPELVVTGHGHAMRGAEMRAALHTLARDFDAVAVPRRGQYVDHPAKPFGGSGYRAVDWR
jgi:glyoxylase-like metal-dependent hydrolase (beta-lactamase superfamily II)